MITAAIFIILFVIILRSLQEVSIFERATNVVVALCVTVLCIIGLHQSFLGSRVTQRISSSVPSEVRNEFAKNISTGTSKKNDNLNHDRDLILLPYTALALAIILSLFLMFMIKVLPGDKLKRRFKETNNQITKAKNLEKTNEKAIVK